MAISNISGSSAIAGNKDSKAWDQTTSFGGFYPIQTIVVPSLGAASVSFTNIPQNFTHLQLRCAITTIPTLLHVMDGTHLTLEHQLLWVEQVLLIWALFPF